MREHSSKTEKCVVVCADDFAIHGAASLGIAKLAELGRVSATSAMVLSPRWPQDAALLAPFRQQLDVGLHLDWTSDFALAEGHGLSLGLAMRRALLRGFDLQQASTVIERQLDLFEAHWHAPPDYVDGHQHVQQFDGIRQALVEVLVRRYAKQAPLPYLRVSRGPHGFAHFKDKVIAWMGANALESIAFDAGLASSDALLGIYDFRGNASRYAQLMSQWLGLAPAAGAILMCHPAQALDPADELGAARLREFLYLAGPAFGESLAQANVAVVRGQDSLLRF